MWFFLLPFLLFAKEPASIKLIATWPNHAESFTSALTERGIDARVFLSDFSEYKEITKMGRWDALLQRLHVDFRSKWPLEERLVFFNLLDEVHRKHNLNRLPKEKMVLFLWEPPNVLGRMYKDKVTRCFQRVYTWDDDLVDGKKFFKFNYPSLQPMRANVIPFAEKKLCTLVNSCLDHPGTSSLYRERKAVIAFFENVGEKGFEFYGRGWDPSQYKSYRGAVDDKLGTISHYRFCIAYENTHTLKGYITEKIFDCFAAGVVPVYWGAPNVTDFIPKGCFIDRRDFASMEELHKFLKGMKEEEYNGYIERIRLFLNSDQAKVFSHEAFHTVFAEAIQSMN